MHYEGINEVMPENEVWFGRLVTFRFATCTKIKDAKKNSETFIILILNYVHISS